MLWTRQGAAPGPLPGSKFRKIWGSSWGGTGAGGAGRGRATRMELGPGVREEGRLDGDVCSAIGNALLAGSGGEKPGRKRQ